MNSAEHCRPEHYPIGVPGRAWGAAERQRWLHEQTIRRSYDDQVVGKIDALDSNLIKHQYGELNHDLDNGVTSYALYALRSAQFDSTKPTALVTGGVHGYETSGVQGALRFLQTWADHYSQHFNLVVAPCISPWGYETINRWNPQAIDPNRSFIHNSPAPESAALMAYIASLNLTIDVHIDLHETTDTDNSEFRPALAARDNVNHECWDIPDGFYLVGDTQNPCSEFQAHIITAVSQVTHIAPSDEHGRIIGELATQTGVINYPTAALGLCTGFTQARFNTTTEVYPDSPQVDDENCILAQVTAVCSGLDFVLR